MFKWTIECEEKYGVCELLDTNPGWMNYLVDEGFCCDDIWFDTEKHATIKLWQIFGESDNNHEVIDRSVKVNETILTVKITNQYSDFCSVEKYRIFATETHNEY